MFRMPLRRALACAALAAALPAGPLRPTALHAEPANAALAIPADYAAWAHYGVVRRGGITERIFTTQDVVAAAKAGAPFPDGAIITMEDHRDGALHRTLVMEKRAEWDELSQAGGWRFREFDASGAPDQSEDGARCEACHASQAAKDFVFTRDLMLDD